MPLLSRRSALTAGLALGGTAVLGPGMARLAQAAELEDRYYIFCYFNGGWDLLLSLDPRDPAEFRDDLKKSTLIDTGFSALGSEYGGLVSSSVPGMVFGPCVGGLVDHADKLTVVRGMSMDTLTHEVGRRRFLTGRPPAGLQAKGSNASTVLASVLGQGQPIPQLSIRVESYNDRFEGFASAIRVNSVQDLVRALRPSSDDFSAAEERALQALLDQAADCPSIEDSRIRDAAMDYQSGSKELVSLGLDAAFDFTSAQSAELRDLYSINVNDLGAAPAQAAAAATALTTGVARTVCFEAASGLDTHGPEWASAHPAALVKGFDVVASLIADLSTRQYKGTSETWLDRTTIVGFSEFGRSTLLNSSGGRDHFLHNACFLAGGGVKGGQVIGRSSDIGMAPTPTDLASGLPSESGEVVYPEHIFRALLQGAGVEEDLADYGVDPLMAIFE